MTLMRILAALAVITALPAAAQERWYVMARHGECFELEVMQRRIPELAEAKDPYAFAERMKQKGHGASTKDVVPGKAVEVRVPERDLAMVFAKRELCQSVEKR
jgi:hypothetical protein